MQERWLNKMAHGGYRLVRTGKLLYEFETCQAGEFAYCAEFIGHMAGERAEEYCGFLKDAGYRVFYKNINLNYSLGKIRFRPWADKGGKIATDFTTFNRLYTTTCSAINFFKSSTATFFSFIFAISARNFESNKENSS